MRGRFSKQQLYELRNRVPIRQLIEKELNIPYRLSANGFRFECPSCHGYHTGVNPETNLARCFDCKTNFNTIDLVIKVRQTAFYESASFLWKLYKTMQIPPPNSPDPIRHIRPVRLEPGSSSELISLGSIMENFGFTGRAVDKKCSECRRKMNERFETLEKDVNQLKSRVDRLEKFVAATSGVKYMRKRKRL